jgi:hypothetical protein
MCAPMTSAPVRDPLADHLLTPGNAAFLFIDYQPAQLSGVRSVVLLDPNTLERSCVDHQNGDPHV